MVLVELLMFGVIGERSDKKPLGLKQRGGHMLMARSEIDDKGAFFFFPSQYKLG